MKVWEQSLLMILWEQSLLALNDNAVNRETEAPASRASLATPASPKNLQGFALMYEVV